MESEGAPCISSGSPCTGVHGTTSQLVSTTKKGDLLCRQNNHDTHSITLLFLHSILQAKLCTIPRIARDLEQFYASQCMQVRIKLFQAPMYAGSHKIAPSLEQFEVLCIIWLARLNVEIIVCCCAYHGCSIKSWLFNCLETDSRQTALAESSASGKT